MKSKENLQKEQLYREFVQREENLIHAPYNPELEFYSCIREGNVEKIKQLCNEPLILYALERDIPPSMQ